MEREIPEGWIKQDGEYYIKKEKLIEELKTTEEIFIEYAVALEVKSRKIESKIYYKADDFGLLFKVAKPLIL